ncbi:MAG: type II toxin-antitoxin system VapC family toxin [Armatimonadota bacterium]
MPSLSPGQLSLIVVDTDVASFLFKQDSRAARYAPHLIGKVLVLSAQSRAELYTWPLLRNWGRPRREALEHSLRSYVIEYPDDRICRIYGELVADTRSRGFQISAGDAWHAATALSLGVPLVTHNARHFLGVTGLELITESGE